ncbi:MAG: hypothetical protein HRT61_23750 [Ekhidna sp.]|nr:hypothetical protein [Ekhidna sp.]
MKEWSRFSWVLAMVLIVGFRSQTHAQTLQATETPVCGFMLMLEQDMSTLMELDGKTTKALALQLKNPEARKLMDESFAIVQQMLNDSTNLIIPEVSALKGAVKYSLMDYPIGTLKKAAKNANYDQYVKVDIMVDRPQSTTTTSTFSDSDDTDDSIEIGEERIRIRPQVRVILKFADANGKVIDRYIGKYKHNEKFEINGNTIGFQGFRLTTDIVAEPIPYHFFLTKAMEDLIRQYDK